MDRFLQFLGRLTHWQVWLGFSVPALIVATVLSQWFGDAALWVLFFTVPAVGFLIFFVVPFVLALHAGNRKQAVIAAAIAVGALTMIAVGWITTR